MARKTKRQRGDSAIANNIAARRSEFLGRVEAQQKEVQRLARIAQAGKTAIAKAEAKINKQKKAVQAAEKNLNSQRAAFQKAEAKANRANDTLAAAQEALDDFDRRLRELVGTTARKPAKRKAATAKPRRGAKKGAPSAAGKQGARKITQAQALVAVLPKDQGIPVPEVLKRVNERFRMVIKKSSAGTTLSLLKRAGKVSHNGEGWRAAASEPEAQSSEDAAAPDASTAPAEEAS